MHFQEDLVLVKYAGILGLSSITIKKVRLTFWNMLDRFYTAKIKLGS
jgi:hypothetical protein